MEPAARQEYRQTHAGLLEKLRRWVDEHLPHVTGRTATDEAFGDTVKGVNASANLYSLLETAKANVLESYAYLRQVFAELPAAGSVETNQGLTALRYRR